MVQLGKFTRVVVCLVNLLNKVWTEGSRSMKRLLSLSLVAAAVLAGAMITDNTTAQAEKRPVKAVKQMGSSVTNTVTDTVERAGEAVKESSREVGRAVIPGQQDYRNKTITEATAENLRFSTLNKALKATGLDQALSQGEYTVFAPTDAAFNALPQDVVDELMQPESRETLKKILTYHVVPGNMRAEEVSGQSTLRTLEGDEISVRMIGQNVLIDNAVVNTANITTKNGTIHAIDRVLLP